MKSPSEKPACPKRKKFSALKTPSGCRQPERGSKGRWDAEQLDRDLARGLRAFIANESFGPAETRVRSLCAGQEHARGGWRSSGGWRQAHLNPLVAHELDTGSPMFFPAPIAPEERGNTNWERMQQHAHLTWLCRGTAIPLTLLAQRTRPTTANAGTIHHAQAPISFSALLMWDEFLIGRNLGYDN